MSGACIDGPSLDRYLAGNTPSEQIASLEQHLQACGRCQAALSQRQPTSDSMVRAIRGSAGGVVTVPEPELAVALSAIARLSPVINELPRSATSATEPSAARDAAADTGRLIRDYELRKKLGEGGMGAVYLALHTKLKKQVAIKLLKADRNQDSSAIARFAVEMEAVGKLEHPNIVRALDAGEENGIHFLVMEYLGGVDLARLLRGLGRLSLGDACEVIRQSALGLHHAHENGVIHRDVKPSNLMLLASGKVKVLDLGLAHFRPSFPTAPGLTSDHQIVGTLLYLAPEQLTAGAKVDTRADIYSLGVTLYEFLLARPPAKFGFAVSITPAEQAARSDVPPDVWQLAARMTSLQREQRPGSMLEVAEALRPWTATANLQALLQRLAGQTTFAVAVAPSSAHGAGGQWILQPPAPPSTGWAAIDVAAPPVVMQTTPPAPRSPLQRWSIPAMWLATAALLCAAAVLVVDAWRDGKGTAVSPKPPAPPAAELLAQVELLCDEPMYEGLFSGLLKQGAVVATQQPSGKRFALRYGINDLPPGEYTLEGRSDACDFTVASFTVTNPRPPNSAGRAADDETQATSPTVLQSIVVLPAFQYKFPWKYPRLPTKAGAQSIFRGTLWHPGLGQPPKDKQLTYRLSLTVLGDENIGERAGRWLEIRVDNDPAYRETAYLLVDVQRWDEYQELHIAEGWLRAESGAIQSRLAASIEPACLTAPFDRGRDTVATIAARHGLALPPDRINIHQALVLLFGDGSDAAPELIRKVRAQLPPPTRLSIELASGAKEALPSLVVRAEPEDGDEGDVPAKPTVFLARCETIAFSFIEIRVTSTAFMATLKRDTSPAVDGQAIASIPDRNAFEQQCQILATLDASPQPFDVARLPQEDGAWMSYGGDVTFPNVGALTYQADLRMVGTESKDGESFRWIEIEVLLPRLDHRERALMLVNEQKYAQRGEFAIKRGWYECGDIVLEIAPKQTLKSLEQELRLVNQTLPTLRLSAFDVASLVFDARMKSQLEPVRPQFAGHVIQHQLEVKPTFKQDYPVGKSGDKLDVDVYELVGGDTVGPGWKIIRSRQAPFDFVEVKLATPDGVALTALASRFERGGGAMVFDEIPLRERNQAAQGDLAAAREKRPNWRLWSLPGHPLPLWAEHAGGTTHSNISLLRDEQGTIHEIELGNLTDQADRDAAIRGRTWSVARGVAEPFNGKLQSIRGKVLTFITDQGATRIVPLENLARGDRDLVERLKPQLPISPPYPSRQPKRR